MVDFRVSKSNLWSFWDVDPKIYVSSKLGTRYNRKYIFQPLNFQGTFVRFPGSNPYVASNQHANRFPYQLQWREATL